MSINGTANRAPHRAGLVHLSGRMRLRRVGIGKNRSTRSGGGEQPRQLHAWGWRGAERPNHRCRACVRFAYTRRVHLLLHQRHSDRITAPGCPWVPQKHHAQEGPTAREIRRRARGGSPGTSQEDQFEMNKHTTPPGRQGHQGDPGGQQQQGGQGGAAVTVPPSAAGPAWRFTRGLGCATDRLPIPERSRRVFWASPGQQLPVGFGEVRQRRGTPVRCDAFCDNSSTCDARRPGQRAPTG